MRHEQQCDATTRRCRGDAYVKDTAQSIQFFHSVNLRTARLGKLDLQVLQPLPAARARLHLLFELVLAPLRGCKVVL
jgi:hypothetical protein